MTKERSSAIMDSIFAAPDQEGHGRLLRIIQDFLTSEAEKHSAVEKGMVGPSPESQCLTFLTLAGNAKSKEKPRDVNMDELVGNTDGFADSGYEYAST